MIPRPYIMTAPRRGRGGHQGAHNRERGRLLSANTFAGMTLSDRRRRRTTVRTVLRIFSSKETLFASALESFLAIGASGPCIPGDVEATLDTPYDF